MKTQEHCMQMAVELRVCTQCITKYALISCTLKNSPNGWLHEFTNIRTLKRWE